ncbi:DUF1810 domain-containing protein [Microbulbifer sp. OS29]|uniref:DUF1810 domain-containing protein n=1 Tax=Microbulbifer okhotskensis TaxID=2926617 RepID=A0A9X2ENE8_9GAMM|nr:DUF1810 domain-containing protein [Microbulbifer okhotskensis]MCO1335482.1 DUF1810 domain-containing protein [Microbulbifer okhotskensis]
MSNYFDLERFCQAQDDTYTQALQELRQGHKRSHWIWYIFPQIKGLGHSATSQRYGVAGLGEAQAYLKHPQLGPRLRECCHALLNLQDFSALEIFGSLDAIKVRSCMTLFTHAAGGTDNLFIQVLEEYYEGKQDPRTLEILQGSH